MNNYQYCAHWMSEQIANSKVGNAPRVLDYGCGRGQIVELLRQRQIAASGCDVFYEDGEALPFVRADFLETGVIRKMNADRIPFEDASFDFVINNQVMEHVENMDLVLAEIQRVLKPGGTVLSLFPDKGVWREGHCGVPFVHWFPKHSQFRIWYTAVFRVLGFGYHKENKSSLQWSRYTCEWLDKWTHYRNRREIHSSYTKYFEKIGHIEEHWFRMRVGPSKPLANLLPASLQRVITQKLGFLVMVANKPA
jgi:ubiquinone/menaquinone biosynthesis C-methylase UbiE